MNSLNMGVYVVESTELSSRFSFIDFRSDTVTKPTQEMLLAMSNAEVGDDVLKDDVTMNLLEKEAAEVMGKEAALFVPSGTMGNLVALLIHCGRGEEVILGSESHIFYYEAAGASAIGSISFKTLDEDEDGQWDLTKVKKAIRVDDIHHPVTKLLCLENTHNRRGGIVLDPKYVEAVTQIAKENGLATHLDGARIFNAATYLKCDVKELTKHFDSVQFCLSKGLGAPVGSLLVGTKEFIARAIRIRKMLGGGMRQVGVLAAPGLISLHKMSKRLQEDHDLCLTLAKGLMKIPGLKLDLSKVHTNIVYVDTEGTGKTGQEVMNILNEAGVKLFSTDLYKIRFVTHHQVHIEDVEKALEIIKRVLE